MWLERAKTGKNVGELEKAYEELISQVKRVDPLTIAEMTDGTYKSDGIPRIEIPSLHSWFVLELLPYRVKSGHVELDTLPMKVLALQHVIAAGENEGTAVKVMGQWIDIRSVQHGALLGAHFSRSTNEILSKFFSLEIEECLARAFKWGGRPIELGDVSFLFHFFPRLPIALVHWQADEEFPAYSKILYDVSVSNYMPTHALTALTEFLIHRLVE